MNRVPEHQLECCPSIRTEIKLLRQHLHTLSKRVDEVLDMVSGLRAAGGVGWPADPDDQGRLGSTGEEISEKQPVFHPT